MTDDAPACGGCGASLADCHADQDSGGDGCCAWCWWHGHRPTDAPTGTVTAPAAS